MALQTATLQGGVALGATSGVLYTVPTGHTAWIKQAVFTNTSGAAVTLTVTLTRAGGSPLVITPGVSVAANTPYIARELASQSLGAGDSVAAFASTGAVVNAFLSGLTT